MEASTTTIQAPDTTPADDTTATASQPPRIRRRKRRGKEAREQRRWFRFAVAALGPCQPAYRTGVEVPRRFVAGIALRLGRRDIIVQVRDASVEEYRTLTIWHRAIFDPLALQAELDAEELEEARAARGIGRPRGARTIPRPWGVSA